jgi:hypothetical protein
VFGWTVHSLDESATLGSLAVRLRGRAKMNPISQPQAYTANATIAAYEAAAQVGPPPAKSRTASIVPEDAIAAETHQSFPAPLMARSTLLRRSLPTTSVGGLRSREGRRLMA